MSVPTVPRLLVSAAHKSSGKTTVTLGLAAAWAATGLAVQCFKKGPDYIDPMWLALASGRPCYNLDPHLGDRESIVQCTARACAGADLALIEGNKGLYDGLSLDGSNSNAALATMLSAPVLLVLDARGMTRGVAPLILGYQAFDRAIRLAGVVLNRVGGARHESKLRAVIEHYTDVPVLGAVAEDPRLALAERHLGLLPCAEHGAAAAWVAEVATILAAQIDLPRVREAAGSVDAAPAPPQAPAPAPTTAPTIAPAMTTAPATGTSTAPGPGPAPAPPVVLAPATPRAAVQSPPSPGTHRARLRIGVARDRAFGFYYPDDLEALRDGGADLVFIDTLRDRHLPALDGLMIGGGFPETCLDALEANVALRSELHDAIVAGLPTYAECGGLMLLARSIRWRGRSAAMVGVIPGDAVMQERPVGRGYVQLAETDAMPWPASDRQPATAVVRGHEFHHASLEGLPAGQRFAWRVQRGHGIDGRHDGLVVHNLLASFSHLRQGAGACWVERFLAHVRNVRPVRASRPRPWPAGRGHALAPTLAHDECDDIVPAGIPGL